MRKIIFIVLICVGSLRSSIIYVEIPEDVTLEEFRNPDSTLVSRLKSLADSMVQVRAANLDPDFPIDFIVFYTKNGEPIPPDTMELREQEGWHILEGPHGHLTPVRGEGWTDAEWADVLAHWNRAEPKIREVYGPPFRTVNVRITKNPSLGGADGVFYPSFWGGESNIEIRSWGSDYWRGVLTHEVIHAFRDDWVCAWDQFEEAMTEAMTVEVQNRIYETWGVEGGYPNLNHKDAYFSYGEYSMHEYWNTEFIGTNVNDFSLNYTLAWFRYKVGGYAWWKVFRADPEFMIRFNEDLWNSAWWWPPSREYSFYRDLAIENFDAGQIENLNFDIWFNNNPIFRINYPMYSLQLPEVLYLGVVPTYVGVIRVFYYWRYFDFEGTYQEIPLSGEAIRIKIWNWNGEMLYNSVRNTDSFGRVIIDNIYLHPGGRYKIEVYPENYSNPQESPWLFKECVFWVGTSDVDSLNFFGAIGSELNNTVYIDGYTLSAENGIFQDQREPYEGEKWLHYNSPFLGSLESWVTKDKGPYHVYIGGNGRIPPAQPQDLFASQNGTMVNLTWSANAELDLSGYYIYRRHNDNPYIKLNTTPISSNHYEETVTPSGWYRYRITAVDIDGNEGGPSLASAVFFEGPALSATPHENAIELQWSFPGTPENFLLECITTGDTIPLDGNVRSFTHTGLQFNTTYSYRIKAIWRGSFSPYSNVATVETDVLNPPTNIQAQVSSPWTSITLTWNDNSNYEDGYEIWRMGYTDSTWQFVGTTGPNQTSYTDAGLQPGQGYLYKVRAFRNDGLNSEFTYALLFTTPNARALFPPSLSVNHPDFGGTSSFNGRNLLIVHDTLWFAYADSGRIYVRYLDPQGNLSSPTLVSGSFFDCSSPTLTQVEDGRIVVVFQDSVLTNESSLLSKRIRYNWRGPAGWGPAPSLVVGAGAHKRIGPPTAVGTPDGKLLVAWVDSTPAGWYLKYAHFPLNGNVQIQVYEHLNSPIPPNPLTRSAFLSPCLVRNADTTVVLYFYSPSEGHLNRALWQGNQNQFAPYHGLMNGYILGFHATPMGSDVALALSRLTNGNPDNPQAQILYMLLRNGTTSTLNDTVANNVPIIYQDSLDPWGLDVISDTFPPHPVIATFWRNPVIAWEQIGAPVPEDSAFLDTLALVFNASFVGIPPTYTVIKMRSGGSWISYDPTPSQHPLSFQFPALAVKHTKSLSQGTAWTLWSHILTNRQGYGAPLVDKGHHVVAFSSRLVPASITLWNSPEEASVQLFHLGDDPGTNLLLFAALDTLWLSQAPRLAQWQSPIPLDAASAVSATLDRNTQTLWLLYPSPSPNTFLLRSYSLTQGLSSLDTLVLSSAPNTLISLPTLSMANQDLFLCYYSLSGSPLDDSLFFVSQRQLAFSRFDLVNRTLDDPQVLATIQDSSVQETLNLHNLALASSPALLAVGSNLYVLETQPDQVTLHTFANGSWQTQILSQNQGPYRSPHIASDGKTVYFLWSQGSPGDIFYRFSYPDDPSFLSKAMNLSNTPDADSKDPWYAGQRLFWAEQQSDGTYAIFHTSMAKPTTPEALSQTPWGTASLPQTVSYTVGGSYYQTTVYVTTWLQEEVGTHQTALLWEVYSTGPIPEQVLTLGDTLPTPYTTQRDTFAQYGTQKGQSADVGNALSYQITDLDPQKSYTLGFYIYHEESTDVIERFYADGQPLKIVSSTPGTETYVEVSIPLDLYQDDSTIVVSVTKESGPTAILNEIYVFGTPLPSGGPMASESHVAIPRAFAIEWIRPLPLRGTGQVQLAIPRVATVSLDLYDITGRRVRRFYHGTLEPGYHTLTLRPEDDRGNRLASGVYFLRLETPDVVKTRKVVWMP